MILRAGAIVLLALLLAPLQLLLAATPARGAVPRLFMRLLVPLIGVRLATHGRRSPAAGTLTVANHLSWADIIVLGAVIDVAFVAKSEVKGWGPVGWLASLSGTIFVERERRGRAGAQADAIADRLRQGRAVVMFPEGGSSDGRVILPFKSALFAAAEASGAPVQPVTLAYTRIGPMPVTRRALPLVAWLGDAPLGAHAIAFLRLAPVRAEVMFHDTVRAADFADRKALADHCRAVVADGYARLMRGRRQGAG